MDRPDWWDWEIEVSSHCAKRMRERMFSEPDLRAILADVTDTIEQIHGTFLCKSRHENRDWEVIVVPDFEKRLIVVVTAYPVD